MPRGVKGSGKPRPATLKAAAALAAVAQVAAAAPPVVAEVVAEVAPPVVQAQEPATELPRGPGFGDSLKRGQRLDLMTEPELRDYARTIGVSPRDCAGLTVERLRQNCTAHLYELIDAL